MPSPPPDPSRASRRAGTRPRVGAPAVALALVLVLAGAAGCSDGSGSSSTSTTGARGGSGRAASTATSSPPRPTTTTTGKPTPSQAREAAAAAQAMREAAVAVMIPVWRDDPGQRGQRDATLGAFDALGGETDDGVRFPPGTVNFTSTVATLAGKVRMARGMGQQPLAIYVVGGSDTDALVAALRASPDLAGVLLFDSDGSRLDG